MWIKDEETELLINLGNARYIYIEKLIKDQYRVVVEFENSDMHYIEGFEMFEEAENFLSYLYKLLMSNK